MADLSKLILNPYTALVLAAVVGGLALSGKFYVTAMYILLAVAWVIVIVGLRGWPFPIITGVGAIAGLGLILLGYWFSPDPIPGYAGILYPKVETVLRGKKTATRKIEIGDSGAIFLMANPKSDVLFDMFDAFKLTVETVKGKLLVSTQIRDSEGKLVAELSRNEWKVAPPPKTWDRNYDRNALEVKNDAGRIVLQIRLLPDRVQIQGEWLVPNGQGVRLVKSDDPSKVGGLMLLFGPGRPPFPPFRPTDPPFIKPIFRYPSETHFGELLEP